MDESSDEGENNLQFTHENVLKVITQKNNIIEQLKTEQEVFLKQIEKSNEQIKLLNSELNQQKRCNIALSNSLKELQEQVKIITNQKDSEEQHKRRKQSNVRTEQFNNENKQLPGHSGSQTQINVPTRNKYGILEEDYGEQMHTETINEQTNIKKNIQKMPPIRIAHKFGEYKSLATNIQNIIGSEEFKINYSKNETRVFTNNINDFDKIKMQFLEDDVQFTTHTPKERITKKIVLKAVPHMDLNKLKESLTEIGLNVIDVNRLKSKNDSQESYSYLIALDKSMNLGEVRKIREIGVAKVRWERYANKQLVTQCFRCQHFGHGRNNCNKPIRCVKCVEPGHLSKDCKNVKKADDKSRML